MTRPLVSLSSGERVGVRVGALVIALSACGGSPSTPAPDAGVDAGTPDAGTALTTFQQGVLDAHNRVRANATPAPSPTLAPMQWSPSAQALAEDWAARCDFQHRDPNSLGENLSAGTREYGAAEVVDDWAAERADYTYSSNTCRPGKACGHYTQLVWRASVGLGCAQQRCTSNSPFGGSGAWYFVVCNYDPAGNYIGQRPY